MLKQVYRIVRTIICIEIIYRLAAVSCETISDLFACAQRPGRFFIAKERTLVDIHDLGNDHPDLIETSNGSHWRPDRSTPAGWTRRALSFKPSGAQVPTRTNRKQIGP